MAACGSAVLGDLQVFQYPSKPCFAIHRTRAFFSHVIRSDLSDLLERLKLGADYSALEIILISLVINN